MIEFFEFLISFAILLVVVFVASSLLLPTKSKTYRRELADMYVAAKIREIAKEESINLDDEYLHFLAWTKRQKRDLKDWSYDQEVEAELKEKITSKLDKKKKEAPK